MKKIFEKCESFQWDEGNSEKNKLNHDEGINEDTKI